MGRQFKKSEIEEAMKFVDAAALACTEAGRIFEFECPICGGKARAIKSTYNGHHQGECRGCGMKFIE